MGLNLFRIWQRFRGFRLHFRGYVVKMLSEVKFASDFYTQTFNVVGPIYCLLNNQQWQQVGYVRSTENSAFGFTRIHFNAPAVEERYSYIQIVLQLDSGSFNVFVFGQKHGIVSKQDEFGFGGSSQVVDVCQVEGGRKEPCGSPARIGLVNEKQSSTLIVNIRSVRKDSTILTILVGRLEADSFHSNDGGQAAVMRKRSRPTLLFKRDDKKNKKVIKLCLLLISTWKITTQL